MTRRVERSSLIVDLCQLLLLYCTRLSWLRMHHVTEHLLTGLHTDRRLLVDLHYFINIFFVFAATIVTDHLSGESKAIVRASFHSSFWASPVI